MLDFMIIGLPRSGTTWLSNWLTTDKLLCIHDPLYKMHYTALDDYAAMYRYKYDKIGVSCTGLWRWSEWVNNHSAKKIVVHRDIRDINNSLAKLNLPILDDSLVKSLDHIDGLHINYDDMFNLDHAKMIFDYITQSEFDMLRYELLREFNVQPEFEKVSVNKEAIQKLYSELCNI